MKNTLLSLTCILALSACGDKPYVFEGRYYASEGDECTPFTTKDKDLVFLEIIAQGEGENKAYTANLPMGASWRLPTSSNGTSRPTEQKQLNFTFSKEGESGFFGGTPSINMTVSVIPNDSKDNHIWLTKWDASVGQNGMVQQMSPLDEMKKDPKSRLGTKGVCLFKKA